MSEMEVQTAAETVPGLTQWQRVADTFTAPSKTFEDIKRGNKSWWMPFLLLLCSAISICGDHDEESDGRKWRRMQFT